MHSLVKGRTPGVFGCSALHRMELVSPFEADFGFAAIVLHYCNMKTEKQDRLPSNTLENIFTNLGNDLAEN